MKQFKARALLFDMDGTLVDSDLVSEAIWKIWAEKYGVSFQAILDVHHGRRPEDTIRLVAPHLNALEHAPFIYDAHTKMTEGLKLIEGADRIFNHLPLSMVSVVTSATKAVTQTRFKAVGLRLDTKMVTSEMVKNGKPHPEPFLMAAKLLNVDPQNCLVFEDAPAGIQAAKAAGMKVIALKTSHQLEALGQADFVIDDYSKVEFTVADGICTFTINS